MRPHTENCTKQLKNTYKLFSFSLPISGGLLLNMAASFLAMLMVAKLGTLEWAAAALAVPTFLAIMTTVSMIFYAIGILISHAKGQHKTQEEIGCIVKNGFWLAIMLFIPSGLLLWNIHHVLILFKQDPVLVSFTIPYFHFSVLTLIPTLTIAIITQLFIGIGKPKLMLFVSIANLPFIFLLSYGFILGKLGFPKMGLAGVTCSTFLVQTISCSGILIYIMTSSSLKKYNIFSGNIWPNFKICKTIFILGLPIGLQFGGELAAMTLSTYLMGFFGATALAASQIVAQYTMLVIMLILGIAQGSSVLMSEAFAKSDTQLIRLHFNSMLIIPFILFLLVFAVFFLFPQQLMKLYLHDSRDYQLVALVNKFFIVASMMLLMDGLRNILSSGLRGLQNSKTPMKIGLICLWFISLPMSYIFAFVFDGGPVGLRIGFISGYLVAAALLWFKMHKKIHFIESNTKAADILPTIASNTFCKGVMAD